MQKQVSKNSSKAKSFRGAGKALGNGKGPVKGKGKKESTSRVLKKDSKKVGNGFATSFGTKSKPQVNVTHKITHKITHDEQVLMAHTAAIMTRAQSRANRKSDKLTKTDIKKFKTMFEDQVNGLLYNDKILRDDFAVNDDDRPDEVDQASTDVEQSMRMRLRNRERLYLFKIEEALRRIEDGIFGLCDTCEEPIERRRLEARPTATLCVGCKEDQERKEGSTSDGLRHKSLGTQVTRFI